MKKRKTFKLYQVKWLDAYSNGGWESIADVLPVDHVVTTVGYLVSRQRGYETYAQNMSVNGNCAERIHIPTRWITHKRHIKGFDINFG